MTAINLVCLLAEVFECDPSDVNPAARINETPGWDSLNHVALMMRLGEMGFPVPMTRIPELTSYAAIESFLNETGGTAVN